VQPTTPDARAIRMLFKDTLPMKIDRTVSPDIFHIFCDEYKDYIVVNNVYHINTKNVLTWVGSIELRGCNLILHLRTKPDILLSLINDVSYQSFDLSYMHIVRMYKSWFYRKVRYSFIL
jgi:hypothetical protein